MKVLVTGATGFLGHWLVARLVNEGHDVRILRRSARATSTQLTKSTDEENFAGLKVEDAIGDITDVKSLIDACREVDTVFHLAGLIAYSKAQRRAMENVNIGGTRNVITACEKNGVRRLVYLSSVVAIGASFNGKVPLDEESRYNLTELNLGYFETKREAERLVKAAVTDGKLDAVMINPSTIYGPGDAKKGSRGVQLKVARGEFPFYTSGGANIVSVEDVIEAIIVAWSKGRKGERYIIANENLTIKDVFGLIATAAGVKAPSIYLPDPVVRCIGKVGDALEAVGRKGPLNSENAWTSILYPLV